MIPTALALLLIASAGLGIAGARVLGALKRGAALSISTGICLGYGLLLFVQPQAHWISNLGVLAAGISLGFLLGSALQTSASVIVFLTTAGVVDLFSFSDGLTNHLLNAYRSGESGLLRFLAIFVELGGRNYAVIGVSDIAILAAAYIGFQKATGSDWSPGLFLLAGLALAFIVGILLNGAPGIPFLALGGFAFLIRHKRRSH